ncbi:putative nuclease HARBI1 [Ixodes scapularis]
MAKRRRLALRVALCSPLFAANVDSDESSASASEDDDQIYAEKFVEFFGVPQHIPKIENYVENVVHAYSDYEFRRNFRLERAVCDDLIARFGSSEFCPTDGRHGGASPKSAEDHVLSFLWYAGNKTCLRDIGGRFNASDSAEFVMVQRVMDFLCDIAPEVIKFPRDKEALAAEFEEIAGFPGVIGCIDGSYIDTKCPANKVKSTYINRHDQTSVTLQAVCDTRYRFLDVFAGPSSKMHDARIFRLSFLSDELPQLCETRKYHLLGDAAYPTREYLMTPYKDYGSMTPEQVAYNSRHTATRVRIENSFGILKQRFRQLRYLEFRKVDKISKFIMACCVVHNLCVDNGDSPFERESETDRRKRLREEAERLRLPVGVDVRDAALRQLGSIKRDSLAQALL